MSTRPSENSCEPVIHRPAPIEIPPRPADDARQRRCGPRAADRVVPRLPPSGRARPRRNGRALRRRDVHPRLAPPANVLSVQQPVGRYGPHRHRTSAAFTMASIIQTVLLVAGPLIGIWIGSRLTSAKDVRQWRRDRCLEAYADVMRGCQLVNKEANRLYLVLSGDHEVQAQLLQEARLGLDNAIVRAVLLSSDALNLTCKELSDCFDRFATGADASSKLSRDEWTKLITEAAATAGKFMHEAQDDLRVDDPSLSVSDWWKKLLGIFSA